MFLIFMVLILAVNHKLSPFTTPSEILKVPIDEVTVPTRVFELTVIKLYVIGNSLPSGPFNIADHLPPIPAKYADAAPKESSKAVVINILLFMIWRFNDLLKVNIKSKDL